MTQSDFREFLRSRDEPEVDWEERRAAWLAAVDRLFDEVGGWLEAYADEGVTCERVPTTLEEEHLGRYDLDALRIRMRGLEARLEPIGANIIGARGRVDLTGFAGRVRLLLLPQSRQQPSIRVVSDSGEPTQAGGGTGPDERANDAWKVATPPPDVRYLDLTEECFLEHLQRVVDG